MTSLQDTVLSWVAVAAMSAWLIAIACAAGVVTVWMFRKLK